MFDEDAFTTGSASIELSDAVPSSHGAAPSWGGAEIELGLGLGDDFELEPAAGGYGPPSTSGIQSVRRAPNERWPTGKPLTPEQASADPVEASVLANYGEPPGNPLAAPLYTYRIVTRRRELKALLARTEAERARAENERTNALATLAERLRPELEKHEQFRRLLEPLAAIDQVASDRGRALASSNAEHAAKLDGYDAELGKLASALVGEQADQADRRKRYDACEESNKRAEAKLKRVQIEVRSVHQVVQQKLGPQGGPIPAEYKQQLEELNRKAQALEPELAQSRTEFADAKQKLAEVEARIDTLRKNERQLTRQKQALGQEFGKVYAARSQGMTDAASLQRQTLAEVAVAVLATPGGIDAPKELLDAVSAADEQANKLQRRMLTELAALDAYDRRRFKLGAWVALGTIGLLLLWIVFKMLASSSDTP